jgi:hypothetical protein
MNSNATNSCCYKANKGGNELLIVGIFWRAGINHAEHETKDARSCGQPRNRARVDVVAASDVAECFAPVAAANRFAPLVRGELERSAQALPARLRPRAAFAGAGADQFALELRFMRSSA